MRLACLATTQRGNDVQTWTIPNNLSKLFSKLQIKLLYMGQSRKSTLIMYQWKHNTVLMFAMHVKLAPLQ